MFKTPRLGVWMTLRRTFSPETELLPKKSEDEFADSELLPKAELRKANCEGAFPTPNSQSRTRALLLQPSTWMTLQKLFTSGGGMLVHLPRSRWKGSRSTMRLGKRHVVGPKSNGIEVWSACLSPRLFSLLPVKQWHLHCQSFQRLYLCLLVEQHTCNLVITWEPTLESASNLYQPESKRLLRIERSTNHLRSVLSEGNGCC